MDKNSVNLHQQLRRLASSNITPVLVAMLNVQKEKVRDFGHNLKHYFEQKIVPEPQHNTLELVKEMISLKEAITVFSQEYAVIPQEIDFEKNFETYCTGLQELIATMPETVIDWQDQSRFEVSQEDGVFKALGKRFKAFLLMLDHIPQKVTNQWRRFRKRKPHRLRPWKREVPMASMLNWYFKDELFLSLDEVFTLVFQKIASSNRALWEIESNMDKEFSQMLAENPLAELKLPQVEYQQVIDELLGEIESASNTLESGINEVLDKVYLEYLDKSKLVGTFELPASHYDSQSLKKKHQTTQRSYSRTINGWANTLNVLHDHYSLDQELYYLRYSNLEQYYFTSEKLDNKVNEIMASDIDEILTYLTKQKLKLEKSSEAPQELEKITTEVRQEVGKSLNKTIPLTIQLIIDQNIPALIDNLEINVKNEVSKLSNVRSIVKDINYDKAIQKSEIDHISPHELMAFEALPDFLDEIKLLKSNMVHNLDKNQQSLLEIPEICDFNLATALAALQQPPQEEQNPKTLALEGMTRALARLQDIKTLLSEMVADTDLKMKQKIMDFNQSILALKEINTVFDINIRIAKAKALEKTKALRKEFIEYFRNILPKLATIGRKRWLLASKYYQETIKRYGISGTAENLSAEVSSFLAETDAAISQLPFVYQRLFEVTPLKNPNFYEARTVETKMLHKAYRGWEKGHFGATALIGEAGSGTTTLTNFFLENLKKAHPVIRLNSPRQIFQEKDFWGFFQERLEDKGIENLDLLVEHLNGLSGKRIIVLENLQHFFLRKVNGFICLNLFYQLLSRTNKNIFWITTVNLYAYHYLNKTSEIEDYFAHNVFLLPLKDEQMTNIVLKRHRVSGYNIYFKPGRADRKSSRFQKLNDEDSQQYLQKEFFSALNKLGASNITLALIFWLRSTIKVEEDTITIGSLKDLDFSFLSNLSSEKLFTLHSLLLHDGITAEHHSLVFKQALEKSKLVLILLYEDGIIINHEDRYFINPLLFRQIVNLLKSKNILH